MSIAEAVLPEFENEFAATRQFLTLVPNDKLNWKPDDKSMELGRLDGHIRAIAPVGDAWGRAWLEGVANPDPYSESARGISLSFNYQPDSEPSTEDVPTDAGFHHPSIYGAYLSGLVLFETITKLDVRRFGEQEEAAAKLGIPGEIAAELQRVAWETQQEHPEGPTASDEIDLVVRR